MPKETVCYSRRQEKAEIMMRRYHSANRQGNSGHTMPLGLLSSGESGEVVGISGWGLKSDKRASRESGHEHDRLEDMGIRPGKTVEMLANEGGGPLLIKVDESRIAIARGMAMKIMVRRK
jgi:ferrous iron transport protein A